MHYVLWTATGLVAGWVAGLVVRGRGYGLVGDLILGSVGGVVGGHLFNALGATSTETSLGAHAATATVGSVIVVGVVRLLRRV